MADLIKREDVNEVIDALEVYTVGRMNTENVKISVLQLQRFINTLKNIPTAYSVESVVAELEKKMDDSSGVYYCGERNAFETAISIVREGVRNERRT